MPYAVGAATPSQIAGAAGERGQRTIFVVDSSDVEAAAHAMLLEAFGDVVMTGGPDEALASVRNACRVESPAAVVTFSDAGIRPAAAIAAEYGLPGHDPATVDLLVDKFAQRRRLNACAVGRVETVDVRGGQAVADLPPGLPLPGVLKPAAGAGSRDTRFVLTPQGVADGLRDRPSTELFVVEQRIPDNGNPLGPWLTDYLSVESVVDHGRVVHLGITGRLPLAAPAREQGLVFPVCPEAGLTADVERLTEQAIRALGITSGLVHTEIKVAADAPQVIEVNARLGGGLAAIMPSVGGLDPVGVAIDLALGRPAPPPPALVGVAVHLYVQPPYDAREVLSIPSPRQLKDLRRLPGVIGVDRRARAGDRLDWRTGSAGRVLDVFVRASSLAELRQRVGVIEAELSRTIEWSRT